MVRRDQGLGARGEGLGARDEGLGTRGEGLGTRGEGLGTRDEGLGARGEGLGARGEGVDSGQKAGAHRRNVRTPVVETYGRTSLPYRNHNPASKPMHPKK